MVPMIEEWKIIPKYPAYAASNLGRIKRVAGSKSKDGIRTYSERILNPAVQSSGRYHYIGLTNGEGLSYHLVHRLVAATFLPNSGGLQCVHHKDGNVFNNRLENLEWCSQKDNLGHARKLGKIYSHPMGAPSPNRRLSAAEVKQIKKLRSRGLSYRAISEKIGDISLTSVGRVCTNKTYRF